MYLEIWLPFVIIFAFAAILAVAAYAAYRRAGRKWQFPRWWRKKDAGEQGEQIVADLLKRCAREGDKIVSNLILTNPETGMTAEIDHIFLSTRGFFVIEVKNLAGTIYGGEEEREWRQVLGWDEPTVNSFRSPIKQNGTHIYNLKKVLHTRVFMENIVIFVRANIENVHCASVFKPEQFEDYLDSVETAPISEQKRDSLYAELLKLQERAVSKEEHIQNIHEQQWKIEHNICPRCGKPLVLRKGPYSAFYGCSGYPDCTFTRQIPKEEE